jgi:transcriptional regulator with XRE-family HTH domain
MEAFASNLRKRAEALGISHAEAARRIGLSERRYGNYVSGRREPDLATLVRIADVLGTTPNDLLGESPADKQLATSKDRVISAVNVLPPPDIDQLAIMIEALAEHRSRRQSS